MSGLPAWFLCPGNTDSRDSNDSCDLDPLFTIQHVTKKKRLYAWSKWKSCHFKIFSNFQRLHQAVFICKSKVHSKTAWRKPGHRGNLSHGLQRNVAFAVKALDIAENISADTPAGSYRWLCVWVCGCISPGQWQGWSLFLDWLNQQPYTGH